MKRAAADAMSEAARNAAQQAAERREASAAAECHAAILFALPQESGGLEDRLSGAVTIRANNFSATEGSLAGRRVVVVRTGVDAKAAARIAAAMIEGHKPWWIVSAGFCGSLSPHAARGEIFVADEVVTPAGAKFALERPEGIDTTAWPERFRLRRGRLVTVDRVVAKPADKKQLGAKHGALAVDMETAAVAEISQREKVPCLSVRIVTDGVDDELPVEIDHLTKQKSLAGKLGAVTGAVFRRPSSVKDLYRLKETALVSSDRLAEFLESLMPLLAPRK
jgi:adenosylhomocysteine nucleosidase